MRRLKVWVEKRVVWEYPLPDDATRASVKKMAWTEIDPNHELPNELVWPDVKFKVEDEPDAA